MSLAEYNNVRSAYSKQDGSRPSLILDLPLDIRFLILDIMFKTSDGVHICFAFPSKNLALYETRTIWHVRGFSGFLLSCRQLYLESCKVLYGSNRFYLSGFYRGRGRLRGTERKWEISQAAIWLTRLGKSIQYLRHVTVHLYGPLTTHYAEDLDILDLVKLHWKYKLLVSQQEAVNQVGSLASIIDFGIQRGGKLCNDIRSQELSAILTKLSRSFGLDNEATARYSRFPKLIKSLNIPAQQLNTTVSTLRAVWTTPHWALGKIFTDFLVEGDSSSLSPIKKDWNIFGQGDMWAALRYKIYSVAHGLSRQPNEIDIMSIGDTSVVQPHLNLNLLLTSRDCYQFIDTFYDDVTFTVSGTYNSRWAELPHWDAVTQFIEKASIQTYPWKKLKIYLKFNLDISSFMDESPLINITPLLMLEKSYLMGSPHDFLAAIEIHFFNPSRDSGATLTASIEYEEIRSDVAKTVPNWSYDFWETEAPPGPDVWINTMGLVADFSYTGVRRMSQIAEAEDIVAFLRSV